MYVGFETIESVEVRRDHQSRDLFWREYAIQWGRGWAGAFGSNQKLELLILCLHSFLGKWLHKEQW